MFCTFFFTILCFFSTFLPTQGQNLISGSSNKNLKGRKSQFEIDFDLPNDVPVAHSIKSNKVSYGDNLPTVRSNIPPKSEFDPEKALKDLSDYEDTVQFKRNGGKFIPNRGRNSFKISDVSRGNSELSRLHGK